MFQGLRTVIYGVSDIEQAKTWYSKVLGFAPYFDQPYYVGFNVGGYELGLDPNAASGNGPTSTGSVSYWGVDDADATYQRIIELGGTAHGPVQDVGDGIKVGTVLDPFGNVFGIIFNPNFSLPTS